MTNELEKQFFDTFGIEKLLSQRYHTSIYGSIENCIEKAKEWSKETGIRIKNLEIASDESIYFDKVYYPQITDRILLELICFIEQIDLGRYGEYEYFCKFNYEDLRTEILAKSIRLAHKKAHSEVNGQLFYNQVRTLFEEG